MRLQADKPKNMSIKDVNHKRKEEMVNDMLKKFGNVTVGIHGQELPKFAASAESKWWEVQNKKPYPSNQSHNRFKQNVKYWANEDPLLSADASADPGPSDPFREVHVPQKKKDTVPDKINHVMYCKPEALTDQPQHQRGYKSKQPWS